MTNPKLYITTPIYYVNGDPHIGHAHTSIVGDIIRRAYQMRGFKVFYTTGTDEHGQKNQEAAEASGLPTYEYLSRQSERFRSLFDSLHVRYQYWVRTTNPSHIERVVGVLSRCWDRGLIVKKSYSGLYCVGCEQFKKRSDLDELGRCPLHLVAPKETSEENYFLKLSPYQNWLVGFLNDNPDWIQPSSYLKEVQAMIREPLEDLCISRPKQRVSLGVELPFDSDFVTYVWFDALINYISNIDWPDPKYSSWWPVCHHLMAKDIIKTHCVYWPIMLRALDLEPPSHCHVHGFWVGEGNVKMSKSLGNVVDPVNVRNLLGADSLRFYLAKTMGTTDSPISLRLVVQTHNSDLSNNLGNLYSRVVKFAAKEYDGRVIRPSVVFEEDQQLREWVLAKVRAAFDGPMLASVQNGTRTIIDIADRLNTHFNDVAPWKLKKLPGSKDRIESVIGVLLDCLRLLFEMATPVIPATSARALENLGISPVVDEPKTHEFIPDCWPDDARIGNDSNLFARVES